MLSAISGLHPRVAQGVLARAIMAALACHEGDTPPLKISGEQALRDALLAEVLTAPGSQHQPEQRDVSAAMLIRLTDELRNLVQPDLADARQRLASRNPDLFPHQQSISFSPFFIQNMQRRFGIKRARAEETVRNPDDARHLAPNAFGMPTAPPLAFFLKTLGTETLLVTTERKAAELQIDTAWRIPPSIMQRQGVLNAFDVFEEFVEEYGVIMKTYERKLIFYSEIPVVSALRLDNSGFASFRAAYSALGVENTSDTIAPMALVKLTNPNRLAIAMAYAIDVRKYEGATRGR